MPIETRIKSLKARQIFDSRGRPTVEVDAYLSDGSFGRASVPAGASTGTFEASELRDGDAEFYEGHSVNKAIENVNGEISKSLVGKDGFNQREIDELLIELDGTKNLQRLGANAILGVSLAVCRASAATLKIPLYRRIAELSDTEQLSMPIPMVNILSGGLHAGGGMDIQDFLFIPADARNMSETIHKIAHVRAAANMLSQEKGLPVLLADEGGLSPGFETGYEALKFMVEAYERAGLKPAQDAFIALDVAATGLQNEDGNYFFPRENRKFSAAQIIELLKSWTDEFPVVSIEDGLGEEDWAGWKILNEKLGKKIQIVGDDLFTTNLRRLEKGIANQSANAVLIKLNQNGTLTGTLDVIKKAQANNFATVVSARSGETEDSFMADLAVGTAAGQIKIGSFRNSERLSKYNQLIRIEEESAAPLAAINFAKFLDLEKWKIPN